MERLLNTKKKIITNCSLIAFYLILASHFYAPPLVYVFGVCPNKIELSPFLLLLILTPSLTELNKWMLIIDLIPHFFLGFDVETALGSSKYALSLFFSGASTNILTCLTIFVLKKFFDISNVDFCFASSASLVLLCMTSFCMIFKAPIGVFTNFASFGILIYITLVVLTLQNPIDLLNCIYALIVNFFVIHWIDNSISFPAYLKMIFPHKIETNNYMINNGDESPENIDVGVDIDEEKLNQRPV